MFDPLRLTLDFGGLHRKFGAAVQFTTLFGLELARCIARLIFSVSKNPTLRMSISE
jgi:hypothetical protein